MRDASAWYQGALGEMHALLAAQKITPSGPGGAIYANDLFSHERGEATVFLPTLGYVSPAEFETSTEKEDLGQVA